jgi:hypothetical protein
MRSRKIDGKALRLANSAKASALAINAKGVKAVTAKAQRASVIKAQRASVEALAKRDYAEAIAWAKPLGFEAWASAQGFEGRGLRSVIEASASADNLEALEALRLLDSHRRYTSAVFAREFEFVNFERLVRIEEASQRQGGINLGLAGYSPADIVQLAVVRAWARAVGHALLSTRAVPAGEAEAIRRALSARSLNDFEDALEAREFTRWNIEVAKSGKVYARKLDTSSKVEKVAKLADTFASLKGLTDAYGMNASFTIGEVQREVKRVKREGIKQVQRMLEGLTFEGIFTASVEASASERESYGFRSSVEAHLGLVTTHLEDDFIARHFEVEDERGSLIEALKSIDLTPAEADALTLVECLYSGMSLDEVREVFDDLDDRKFARVISASQDLTALVA